VAVGAVGLVALVLLSGGTRADPRTPPALPGRPPPFLGIAVVGSGGGTEAVDAYGDVVGRWAPGPAGRSLIYNPPARQAAGSVPADTGIVARMRIGGRAIPLWRADSVTQRYLPGTNVLRTVARVRGRKKVVVRSVGGPSAARADRRWLARARALGAGAPRWARAMYLRSLLVLRALTDRRSGAVAAGPREGWAYVWPRDASAVAMALAAAGYRAEARRVVRFLLGLDLAGAARFRGTGEPVPGRGPQGDAAGWVAAAARAAGVPPPRTRYAWRDRPDYQEGESGDYLANAIASAAAGGHVTGRPRRAVHAPPPRASGVSQNGRPEREIASAFGRPEGLMRRAGEPGSGLDSAAAWAVRPFRLPALFPLAERTLLRLAAHAGPYGIDPSEGWSGGNDPWTAPTAWSAWSLASLANLKSSTYRRRSYAGLARVRSRRTGQDSGRATLRRLRGTALRDRHAARRLMADLRRASTPTGLLPERVDARTGVPRSTTPLAWSHAFAILALRELWPGTGRPGRRQSELGRDEGHHGDEPGNDGRGHADEAVDHRLLQRTESVIEPFEAIVDPIEALVDFAETAVDLAEAPVDFVEPVLDHLEALLDFVESVVDGVEATVDFLEALVDLVESAVDFLDAVVDRVEAVVDMGRETVHALVCPALCHVVHVARLRSRM
jgi:glucoamylase